MDAPKWKTALRNVVTKDAKWGSTGKRNYEDENEDEEELNAKTQRFEKNMRTKR